MYHIYKLIDPITHTPFYIGKGSGAVVSRLGDHLNEATKSSENQINQLKCNKINKILRSNGSIIVETILFEDEDEAYECEYNLIKEMGRKINNTGTLTNIAAGGRGGWANFGKVVFQFNLDGELLYEYSSTKSAADSIGVTISAIWAVLSPTKPNTQSGGFMWSRIPQLTQKQIDAVRKRKKQKRKVYQINKEGRILNTFSSINCAAKTIAVQFNSIGSCLNQPDKTCNGHFWVDKEHLNNNINVIGQYTNNELVATFINARQAGIATNISSARIGLALNNKILSASGFQWCRVLINIRD